GSCSDRGSSRSSTSGRRNSTPTFSPRRCNTTHLPYVHWTSKRYEHPLRRTATPGSVKCRSAVPGRDGFAVIPGEARRYSSLISLCPGDRRGQAEGVVRFACTGGKFLVQQQTGTHDTHASLGSRCGRQTEGNPTTLS
ncbi:unnamed protein product, partial [Pylaiella littoralis]